MQYACYKIIYLKNDNDIRLKSFSTACKYFEFEFLLPSAIYYAEQTLLRQFCGGF